MPVRNSTAWHPAASPAGPLPRVARLSDPLLQVCRPLPSMPGWLAGMCQLCGHARRAAAASNLLRTSACITPQQQLACFKKNILMASAAADVFCLLFTACPTCPHPHRELDGAAAATRAWQLR